MEEQLKRFVQEHPDTKLIIIDTLQKIREAGGDKYSYANDYEVVGKLKRLADACGVCLLLVHHTRKQQADDKFDMISGTNGLSGAADGAFLLQKEKRTDGTATLDVVGRDQQDQRLYLIKDKEHLTWTLERMETELWVEPPDPVLEAVAAFITAERPSWGGTATELAAALQTDMKPNALAPLWLHHKGTALGLSRRNADFSNVILDICSKLYIMDICSKQGRDIHAAQCQMPPGLPDADPLPLFPGTACPQRGRGADGGGV